MEKGRFYKVNYYISDYFFALNYSGGKSIYINHQWPAEQEIKTRLNVNELGKQEYEITDFCNNLCFEILKSKGIEYDKKLDILKNVIYLWDANLIPGEKFIGVRIRKMTGDEENWIDLFPNINSMEIDILSQFRFDLDGYTGLRSSYRLYLPYDENNLEIYKKYIEYQIESRWINETNLERKIKI